MARLIAVTSCPTGIAHSMMAAEAIKKTAALMGHEIQVEVHGAEGTTNPLSAGDHRRRRRGADRRRHPCRVGALWRQADA